MCDYCNNPNDEQINIERMKFKYLCTMARAYPSIENKAKVGRGPGHWHRMETGRLEWWPSEEANAWIKYGIIK